jgi:cytoskeletal protein CcmA (bactofilin family)
MPTTIITKYGSGAPTTSDVVQGELAVDTTNGRLYTLDGSSVIEIGLNPSGNVDVTGTVTADGGDFSGQVQFNGTAGIQLDDGAQAHTWTLDDNFTSRLNIGTSSASAAWKIGSNNTAYLTVSPTGIDVTGVVEATGYLAVEGTSGNTGVATDRWIGGDGTAGTWFYNVPTGSNHYFAVNNTNVLGINSTGIDVTGTVTADGLTVDGSATIDGASGIPLTLDVDSGGNTNIQFNEGGALRWYLRSVTSSNDFNFYGNSQSRLNIGSGGDISFYDTSGNAKLFWDASARS